MKKEKLTILIALLLIMAQIAYAIPAIPDPVTFTQPDGNTLTVLIKGDERIHWHETMDGYTLLYNQEGYLTYAQLDEDENLQSSDYIASNIEERDIVVHSFLNTIEKNLFYSDIQKQLMVRVWEIEDEYAELSISRGERGVIGQYKTICAFVQFPNKSFIKTMGQFEGLMNQLGYTGNANGSVRDFFKEASYNQFDLIITLCGFYTAPQNESYYAGTTGSQRCQELASWLAQQVAAEPDINFEDYDSDNNGMVDGFHFIFAGVGRETGGGSSAIWSHKWQFSPAVVQNGKSIFIYSCSPELLSGSNITTIGVICHEMTHAFGAADFYDTSQNPSYTGTGNWDLMAGGSWNGSPDGSCPPHQNMYVKVQFGWVTPVLLNLPVTIVEMPNSTENHVAYRIDTDNGTEHYLLENKQNTGFNTSVPGNGLLIYHVHGNIGSNINAAHPQRMYPVCASSTTAIPAGGSSGYGDINSGGCTFPGTANKTSFTSTSTPMMFHWTNTPVDKPLTNITQNNANKTVSFDFMGGGSIPTYTITASCGANGFISSAGVTTLFEGGSQTYTITPVTHYDRATVLVNDVNMTDAVNTGTYTFTNVTSDQTIHATFAPTIYTVTFNANTGTGNMNPQDFTYGEAQNLTENSFTKEGYAFNGWNTQTSGSGTSYTDQQNISPIENITLFAQWELISLDEFIIIATATSGGEITPSGEVTVVEGTSQTFFITPEADYVIIDVLVDEKSMGAIDEYIFENIVENHTIHAIFEVNGISDPIANNSSLQIIPNPANHFIELRITNYELRVDNIEFYNTFGQLVKSVPFNFVMNEDDLTQRISIADLSKGIYLVKAGGEMAKLVVQ